jgi:hypothetical protein
VNYDSLGWYDESYDKAYQGIIGATELSPDLLLISVSRDSHPVIYSPITKQVVKKLSLAERNGNPKFNLIPQRRELWADDYDTLLKLDIDSFNVIDKRKLQESANNLRQFIGEWTFNRDYSLCFIARPFSGDIIAVSSENLKTKYICSIGKKPLEVGLTPDGKIFARDWQSGDLLKGSLKRRWFA